MEWSTVRTELATAFADVSARVINLSHFIKVVLLIGGAAAATVALGLDIAHANKEISAWTIVGLAGAALVALGSLFDVFREKQATQALVIASKALDAVHERELELAELTNDAAYDKAVTRGFHLYSSMDVMRGAIEQSLDLSDIPATTIIQTCLDAASNSLLGAFDFGITDVWTVCIFMARREEESGRTILHCVAHLRKIPCNLNEARTWPEGVGVAGIAYSTNREMIIEDLSAPTVADVFALKTLSRDYDKARFASMVAVPINIGKSPKPWGVAVASSDQASHFSQDPSYGVATVEPARAIAAMSALAVKAAEAKNGSRDAVAPRGRRT